jgi:D-alanyl-D-alanine carboxypeptidase
MRLRAVAATIFILGFASTGLAAKAAPEPVEVVTGPYIVADVNSGRVIEEFDALRPWYPASTTKLMTLYVTFEAIRAGEVSFGTIVHYSANAANQPASKMGFRPGTVLSLDNALKMMLVKSANDIAVAVAETIGGSVAGFSDRMNDAARRLGMTRSHFVTPNGLPDDDNYTTARDMAILARALLTEFREYDDYFKLPAIQIGGRVLKNYNKLLERYPGATGMKTGFICASGYNLVASAKRGSREVIAVVFGQYGGKARTERAAKLLDDGFASSPPEDSDVIRLADAQSGASYQEPFDMRPLVCGPHRVRSASEGNDEGDDPEANVSHLTTDPIYLGPPVKVSALVPAIYGESAFVAPLPRPRPGSSTDTPPAAVLNAYAPGDGSGDSAPADAIGAAAGSPRPLDQIAPQ